MNLTINHDQYTVCQTAMIDNQNMVGLPWYISIVMNQKMFADTYFIR